MTPQKQNPRTFCFSWRKINSVISIIKLFYYCPPLQPLPRPPTHQPTTPHQQYVKKIKSDPVSRWYHPLLPSQHPSAPLHKWVPQRPPSLLPYITINSRFCADALVHFVSVPTLSALLLDVDDRCISLCSRRSPRELRNLKKLVGFPQTQTRDV